MTSETIRAFTRAEPFKPFRVILTTGERFHVARPDQAMAGGGMLFLHPDTSRSPERAGVSAIHLQLSVVSHVEVIEPNSAALQPREGPPMTVADIQKSTRAQPFKPFRATLTNGEEFDIRHPDMIVAGSGMVYLQRPGSRTHDEEPDVVHASMLHLLKIGYLTEAAAPPVDRSTV